MYVYPSFGLGKVVSPLFELLVLFVPLFRVVWVVSPLLGWSLFAYFSGLVGSGVLLVPLLGLGPQWPLFELVC